jgi:ElaB/YqjD/DUF883 family membrane-anchored ribosome-binding protein
LEPGPPASVSEAWRQLERIPTLIVEKTKAVNDHVAELDAHLHEVAELQGQFADELRAHSREASQEVTSRADETIQSLQTDSQKALEKISSQTA